MKYRVPFIILFFASSMCAREQLLQFEQPLPQTVYMQTIEMCKELCDLFDAFDVTTDSSRAWQQFSHELALHVGVLERQIEKVIAAHKNGHRCSLDDLQYLMDVIYEISRHHKKVFTDKTSSKVGYTKVVLNNIREKLYDVLQVGYERFLQII